MTIWDSLGCESGEKLPFSDLKRPMNQSPLTWAPYFICNSLGSHVAIGYAMPCLASKQTPHRLNKSRWWRGDTICICITFPALLACGTRLI